MPQSSQNPGPASTAHVVFEVSKDGWTGGLQLGISELDENGGGHGFRLAGPKFNGSSKTLLKYEVTERDADEIRKFLDVKFPAKAEAPRTERARWQAIVDALNAAEAAGMAVGIDLDGTLTDHNAWSVIWDRDAKQWVIAGYSGEEADR
ncbi:hypothetical protein SAMN06272781_6826 [Streptomyces sp. 1222.2]|uniref:hypothetical protein n=1 Tax=Streptomyces sp. 1222.2 TaxID=1938833 RepID=UPI000BCB1CDF|nr:hypothetical protein [Streptomyces sp. 1222.2]SOD80017.1 hypothetical protein SAMN06272781_6826 [Streptomyces sp. 1222.2]